MSDDKQEEGQPQQVFVPVTAQPAPEPDKDTKDTKDTKKKQDNSDVPVGQIAASGAGATVLGSYALASAVGPWGWAAAPAAAVVGGAGYVAYRRRKKRGGSERSTKTTITRTRGGTRSRGGFGGLRGGGSGSGRGLKGRHRPGLVVCLLRVVRVGCRAKAPPPLGPPRVVGLRGAAPCRVLEAPHAGPVAHRSAVAPHPAPVGAARRCARAAA